MFSLTVLLFYAIGKLTEQFTVWLEYRKEKKEQDDRVSPTGGTAAVKKAKGGIVYA